MESPPSTIIESLPSDVMVRILEFADLPETVLLASSSKVLQEIVYKQCEPSWVHIHFRGTSSSHYLRLTDTMLASLLVRVNARNITKTLTFFRNDKLRGFGLAPLSHSSQLRSIRLETRFTTEFDMSVAVPILRTMIPHQLFHVRFGSYTLPRLSSTTLCFLSDLRVAKLEQASTQRIKCACCEELVAGEARTQRVLKRTGPPSTRCETCQNHFCRRPNCDIAVSDCRWCGDTSCETCAQVNRCSACAQSFCEPCDAITTCEECSNKYCEDCAEFIECEACGKEMCERCNDLLIHPIRFCGSCMGFFCGDCVSSRFCDSCEQFKYRKCAEVKDCVRCQTSFCVFCLEVNFLNCCEGNVCLECEVPDTCSACESKFCAATLNTCGSCSKQFCSDCRELIHCSSCEKDYCMECRDVNHFPCCETEMCEGCMAPNCCVNCGTTACTKHIRKCKGECERSFCKDCSMTVVTECDSCEDNFCTECCCEMNTLICCAKSLCVKCTIPKEFLCAACNTWVCPEHIETCEKCELSFCQTCRVMNPCGGCGHCFCNDDECPTVDVCEICNTAYCEECAIVSHCVWCSHSACEECRKKGGFCRMCNDKPPRSVKKRRLTGR